MSSDSEDEEIEKRESLRTAETVQKYRAAGAILQTVLQTLIPLVVPGAAVLSIISTGDRMVADLTKKMTRLGAKLDRGSAFPCCLSINNCCGHFSPLSDDKTLIKEGDLVKIDLGVQVDGYIAVGAHTVVARSSAQDPITDKKADVICAAHFAAEAAFRLLRPGNTNSQVSDVIGKVVADFHTNPVEGVLSHQMKRYVIDGNKTIINKPTLDQKVNEITFEEYEVYAIDIVVSSGEGKAREVDARTTIYKRALDQTYLLKLKTSRQVFHEINSKFPAFPFTMRALGNEQTTRLGILEIVKHELVHPFPVLFEKNGEFVAQFKFTALILPGGTEKLTSFDLPYVKSEHSLVNQDVKLILDAPAVTQPADAPTAHKKRHRKKKKTTPATTTTTTTSSTSKEAPTAMDIS